MLSALTRRPHGDFWNMTDELNRFLWNLSRRESDESETGLTWKPSVDVKENENEVKIQAELPGISREDVKINVSDGVLTFSGERQHEEETKRDNYYHFERSFGRFARSFSLPRSVDPDKVKAKMKDGILEIAIPKREEAKPKQVAIN